MISTDRLGGCSILLRKLEDNEFGKSFSQNLQESDRLQNLGWGLEGEQKNLPPDLGHILEENEVIEDAVLFDQGARTTLAFIHYMPTMSKVTEAQLQIKMMMTIASLSIEFFFEKKKKKERRKKLIAQEIMI